MEKLISVEELQEKLNRREPIFILDVRPPDQRKEWQIAGSTHIDAYKRLNDGDKTVLDEVDIPVDATVVTVCAAGRTSLIASRTLRQKGVDAYSLHGGMKAWNYAWNTAEVTFENDVKVIQVRRAAKGVLSYVIGSAGEAVVIDAALDPAVYMDVAKQNGWTIKYVMDTHIHADYVSRTRELANASKAKHLMLDKTKVDFKFVSIRNGDSIRLGASQIEFVHTPGHTWESTAFKVANNAIFTGDTLFIDSVGRPDLKADKAEGVEKAKALYTSLKNLLSLNEDIVVFPAHTSKTVSFDGKLISESMKAIKSKVKILDLKESDFVEQITTKTPPAPPNYQTIAMINKTGSYEGQVLADLEAGGNHCAIG